MEYRHDQDTQLQHFGGIATSAMPPGVVPKISVGTAACEQQDSTTPNPKANTSVSAV